MPYTDNRGVRVHYRIEGAGPPLVLQHGFTQSVEDWYECGYVDALSRDYRLILVDARGHGGSDKPHDSSTYPLEKRVSDVVAVMRWRSIRLISGAIRWAAGSALGWRNTSRTGSSAW
jgi:pimeloyl-ACP methyl ester carboxylesterase